MDAKLIRTLAKRWCRQYGCPNEVDDCVQEAFLSIEKCKARNDQKQKGNDGFFYMVARNAIISYLRRWAFVSVRNWNQHNDGKYIGRKPVILTGSPKELLDYRERSARFTRRLRNFEDEFGPLTTLQTSILTELSHQAFGEINKNRAAKNVGVSPRKLRNEIKKLQRQSRKA